jgi:hypothetical protein
VEKYNNIDWFFTNFRETRNPKIMDRLSIISGALFFTADVFAVASLAMPRWIVSDIGGNKNKTTKTK